MSQALDPSPVGPLLEPARGCVLERVGRARRQQGGGDWLPGTNFKHMWHDNPVFRSFIFDSPAAEVTARIIQSSTIRFFFDMIFYKDAGAAGRPTPWHNDHAAWPAGLRPGRRVERALDGRLHLPHRSSRRTRLRHLPGQRQRGRGTPAGAVGPRHRDDAAIADDAVPLGLQPFGLHL